LREEFLARDKDSIKSVEQEIQILNGLNHQNIVNILGYGSDGYVKKPSGREIKSLVYIILEYVTGGLLFDVCQTIGGMGEDTGRYFLTQMIDVLSYLQSKNVVHRDLKLENILVDDQMNLKVADFGFATYKKINRLNSYRGTMTYMAPEIKEGKTYDGKQIDMFSTGVILFIIVQGIFPFKEAKKDEYFYNLLLKGEYKTYWKKVGGQGLSEEFKDLMTKIFSHDGKKRPTVEELKNHPWMQKPFSMKMTRQSVIERLQEKRAAKTTDSSREDANSRAIGDPMLELVRESSALEIFKFNDMTDHDISVSPGTIWEDLQTFNTDYFDDRLRLEQNIEKKYFKLFLDDDKLEVKIKFFQLAQEEEQDEEQPQRLRMRLTKKRGDLSQWYDIFNDLKDTVFEETLLSN